jgi:hypothetical protein
MVGLRFRTVTLDDQVQEGIQEILDMDKGLTTMADSETTQVLLREEMTMLQMIIQNLGMQCRATTTTKKVILQQHVLNRELGAVSFTSRHY